MIPKRKSINLSRLALLAWALLPLSVQVVRAEEVGSRLTDAAEKNDAAAVTELIKRGLTVNERQVDGMTALHWTVHHSNEDLTLTLIAAQADVAAVNRYGVSPLSIACMNGNGTIVRALLEAGADPETELPGGETALMTAARTGRLAPVKELLARGANVNAKEHKGQTALMWASAEGNLEVVDALLAAGAKPRTALPSGFTSLFFAVREGRTAVVIRLVEDGLDVDASMRGKGKNRLNPLLLAVENAHYETALALVESGANPNAQPTGYAALHAISWVRKPIRGDGDPPPVGSGKVSALEFVKAMVERGAEVNLRLAKGRSGFAAFTTSGSTPFVLAAQTGDLPLMRTLLDLHADPTITNVDHSPALLAAAGIGDLGSGQQSAGSESEAIEAAKLLLELGADVNAVDKNGETAMHGAAYQNWPRLVKFLADHGADVKSWHRKNRWGWTPLLIAQGYRKGNFRPDVATVEALSHVMRAAGVTPPQPKPGVVANQQNWDKKKPSKKVDPKTKDTKKRATKKRHQDPSR